MLTLYPYLVDISIEIYHSISRYISVYGNDKAISSLVQDSIKENKCFLMQTFGGILKKTLAVPTSKSVVLCYSVDDQLVQSGIPIFILSGGP